DRGRPIVPQQVLDELAAAIAGVGAVAMLAAVIEVVEAGQVRDGVGVDRGERQPCVDRAAAGWRGRLGPPQVAGRGEGVRRCVSVVHGLFTPVGWNSPGGGYSLSKVSRSAANRRSSSSSPASKSGSQKGLDSVPGTARSAWRSDRRWWV